MNRIFVPTQRPRDWRRLLPRPTRHWRRGRSARALAHCWEDADGFPSEIASLFYTSDIPSFRRVELLLALPEYKVPLPGGRRPSHNDVFALGSDSSGRLVAVMVEGKLSEAFGPTLAQWNPDKSSGKRRRLSFIKEQLGLTQDLPLQIRYQLLNRSASAVVEACRFNAASAIMIVHSFSRNHRGLEGFLAFVELFGAQAAVNQLVSLRRTQGVDLYAGWAKADPKYLAM